MSLVRNLMVGDPHVTPEELPDAEALMHLVCKAAQECSASVVTITGDLYNTHDTVSTRVIEFWMRWFAQLRQQQRQVVVVRGNHDQTTPSQAFPHSLLAHEGQAFFVTEPVEVPCLPGIAAMPYYYDPAEFLRDAAALRLRATAHTLFCHQTFDGSKYDNGFYAKDGVVPATVPFPRIFSGHIHTPQDVGKVTYIGAPRWRTMSDANIDRHIWVTEVSPKGVVVKGKVPTDSHCRRIWKFDDYPDKPARLDLLAPERLTRDRIEVHVFGPTAEYVREREQLLRARYGVKPKGFPDRVSTRKVSESMGIDTAFVHFAKDFRAPNGTPGEVLLPILEERLSLRH